ncbi:MAG: helix-turn-helix transcriptional regulator [Candidatus Pristimantibacillus sp.]
MKNNVKELRSNHNITQDELAERLNVSRQTIISLEKERYNPSITLAFKLARVFNCQIEEIFIYEEE